MISFPRSHRYAPGAWILGLWAGLALGLSISVNAAIEGDLLGSPIPKDGPSWSWTGLLGKATREPGEPEHVLENLTGHSVWFRWTAPFSGPFGLIAGRPGAEWFSAGVTLQRLRPAIPHLRPRSIGTQTTLGN